MHILLYARTRTILLCRVSPNDKCFYFRRKIQNVEIFRCDHHRYQMNYVQKFRLGCSLFGLQRRRCCCWCVCVCLFVFDLWSSYKATTVYSACYISYLTWLVSAHEARLSGLNTSLCCGRDFRWRSIALGWTVLFLISKTVDILDHGFLSIMSK